MPYQYFCPCPQQKMLEGAEAYAGQPVQCPHCQQVFSQPPPGASYPAAQPQAPMPQAPMPQAPMGYPGAAPMPGGYPGAAPMPGGYPGAPQMGGPMTPQGMPNFPITPIGPPGEVPNFGAQAGDTGFSFTAPEQQTPTVLHIACPERECPYQNPVMDVPSEMVGQDVMCPCSRVALTLRYEDSLEYKKRREEYQLRKEEKFARSAMNWAIAAVVIVIFGLAVMMFLASA